MRRSKLKKGHGEWVGPIPEASPVGESQSNARAEKSVQQVEDLVRTHLAELEARMGVTISNEHPILSWLVEYVAVLINKYHVAEGESESAYQKLHGNDPSERLAYFGEKVFFFVPPREDRILTSDGRQGYFLALSCRPMRHWLGFLMET